jgi:hypothetical protein
MIRYFRSLVFAGFITGLFAIAVPSVSSQVGVGVNIGPAPVCPYGYFGYAPYNCAPYGYYGPDWFRNGAFIGVGPWFRGPATFNGPVNSRFDPRTGFRGPLPRRGSRPNPGQPVGRVPNFRGNQRRDGRGNVWRGR